MKGKPLKLKYCIWSIDGQWDVVWGAHKHLNLVEVSVAQG